MTRLINLPLDLKRVRAARRGSRSDSDTIEDAEDGEPVLAGLEFIRGRVRVPSSRKRVPRLLGGKRNLFSFQGTPGEIRSLFIETCTLRPDCQTRKLQRKAEERERRSKRRMCSGDKNGLPSVSAACY